MKVIHISTGVQINILGEKFDVDTKYFLFCMIFLTFWNMYAYNICENDNMTPIDVKKVKFYHEFKISDQIDQIHFDVHFDFFRLYTFLKSSFCDRHKMMPFLCPCFLVKRKLKILFSMHCLKYGQHKIQDKF
jgi:hypothetical protein